MPKIAIRDGRGVVTHMPGRWGNGTTRVDTRANVIADWHLCNGRTVTATFTSGTQSRGEMRRGRSRIQENDTNDFLKFCPPTSRTSPIRSFVSAPSKRLLLLQVC